MGRIIAIANQKGGVGKTTTTVNLSAALGLAGKKTLLVDIDPQGNSTSGIGINKRNIKGSTYDLLIGRQPVKDLLINTVFDNLHLLPSNIDLAGVEIELVEMEERVYRLRNALVPIKDWYDYILIDCPPSLGLITLNALSAADSLMVPIQCEYYALEGLSQLIKTVRLVKEMYNRRIEIGGVLLTMYDARLNLTVQVVEEVKKYFPGKVFRTTVPRNVRLSEAPSFGVPAVYYDQSARGAKAYLEVAEELMAKYPQAEPAAKGRA